MLQYKCGCGDSVTADLRSVFLRCWRRAVLIDASFLPLHALLPAFHPVAEREDRVVEAEVRLAHVRAVGEAADQGDLLISFRSTYFNAVSVFQFGRMKKNYGKRRLTYS